ncbi:MAG: extracellular solute-binding protein [Acidimicrobiaceae bacterium]|nr:extracellular solute-binding protein [Acidimicrobiaceae bacterium]
MGDGRKALNRRWSPARWRGIVGAGLTVAVATTALPATSAAPAAAAGRVTLTYYNEPDSSPATQDAANRCSTPQYKIHYIKLPNAADSQRQQLVLQLAAHSSNVDIMGLDVTWESEFAQAGWITPWTGPNSTPFARSVAARVRQETLAGPLSTATVNTVPAPGRPSIQLVALPQSTNTELLWYRSDVVKTPPKTWAQMLSDAEALAKQGKPHYIEIQGAQYEGLTVWFNSLVASAGGSILNPGNTAPSLGKPALHALQIMSELAHSSAADPSLSVQMENDNRLAMEAGGAAFEINYPFVYPAMKADNPKLFQNFHWTYYPGVNPGQQAHPTLGGIDLAISSYSSHKQMAEQAAACLISAQNQLEAAVVGGLPPVLKSLYTHPTKEFVQNYPFYQLISKQLSIAAIRPKTPEYEELSIYVAHTLSPPRSINPNRNLSTLDMRIKDALAQRGLIP